MKKTIILLVLIIFTLFLAGCKTAGKAIELPSDPTEPFLGMERVVNGNTVTLNMKHQALASNEIVLIAEKLPDGVSYIQNSASIPPMFNDDSLLIWLFARNPIQQLGVVEVNYSIPNAITYRTNVAVQSGFLGKWGLKELNMEGYISTEDCVPSCAGKQCGDNGCGGSCGSCTSPLVCDLSTYQCVPADDCPSDPLVYLVQQIGIFAQDTSDPIAQQNFVAALGLFIRCWSG